MGRVSFIPIRKRHFLTNQNGIDGPLKCAGWNAYATLAKGGGKARSQKVAKVPARKLSNAIRCIGDWGQAGAWARNDADATLLSAHAQPGIRLGLPAGLTCAFSNSPITSRAFNKSNALNGVLSGSLADQMLSRVGGRRDRILRPVNIADVMLTAFMDLGGHDTDQMQNDQDGQAVET